MSDASKTVRHYERMAAEASLRTSTLPTPITAKACFTISKFDIGREGVFPEDMQAMERDAMTMALRLYSVDPETFAPETREVMDRWRPRVEALMASATVCLNPEKK